MAALIDERSTAIFAANNELTECAWRLLRRRRLFCRATCRSWASTTCRGWRWSTRDHRDRAADGGSRPLRIAAAATVGEQVLAPHVEILEPTLVVRGSTAAVHL